jgi:ubiquinone/menaquinone biosynthesis C-methylase UbiE
MDAKERVRSQFGRAAASYATSDVHARGDSLAALVALLEPRADWVMLDVGTGAGHTALTLAPHVARVIATDLTPEMLGEATRLAAERGVKNVETRPADAETLPFPDGSFDLVTCRLAFHHFTRPERAVEEFVRVLKPGGTLGFTDNVAIEDAAGATFYNDFERLRDPSHHEVLSLARLVELFERKGLRIAATRSLAKEFAFEPWADRMHVSAGDKARLIEMLRTAPPAARQLLAPRSVDGVPHFSLWEGVIVAQRLVPPSASL